MGLRLLRINESIRETLSSVITSEGLKDPRIGFVTVTGVDTTPDLRHAKVFVSVLGGRAEREATLEALEKSRGFLQARINATLHMKRTPQLQFVYDDTLDRAMHIQKLMKREEEVLGSEAPEIVVGGADDAGAPLESGGEPVPGEPAGGADGPDVEETEGPGKEETA